MNDMQKNRIPGWYWAVAIFASIWNMMGVMAFISTISMTPEDLSSLPLDQAELYRTTPIWANIAFGFAVFGGVFGGIALLLRNVWAKSIFIASLCGVIVQMIHAFFISNSFEVFGPGGLIMPILVVVFAIGLIWFADFATKKEWIK